MVPVIGVTATLKEDVEETATRPLGRFVRADYDYVDGVAQAGGAPVVLPPAMDARAADSVVDTLDGLLLSGGSDLHPSYYGEDPIPELDVIIPERDELEMVLLDGALRRGIPVFGICRGLQVLNVALGGTLYQDLPSQVDQDLLKHRQTTPKWQATHEIEVLGDTHAAECIGAGALKVNSYHHQAIKDLAEDFTVSAKSSDGIVEAVEYRDLSERWIVAVQWHAEAMRQSVEHRNLFEAHVAAAKRHARRRAAA
ncbi:MAG: gamma-glutamyl-gamma-aminobutyrate hydrolase family protein [Rubrobacteraceae bacterium]